MTDKESIVFLHDETQSDGRKKKTEKRSEGKRRERERWMGEREEGRKLKKNRWRQSVVR